MGGGILLVEPSTCKHILKSKNKKRTSCLAQTSHNSGMLIIVTFGRSVVHFLVCMYSPGRAHEMIYPCRQTVGIL